MGGVIVSAIGEAIAYLAGLVLGRTLRLEPRRAQRIGEAVVLAFLAGGLIVLTVIYS